MPSFKSLSLLAAFLSPIQVSAHGYVSGIVAEGLWYPGGDPVWYYYPAGAAPKTAGWQALNQDIGFVSPASFGTSDIACHKSATPGQLYVPVKAGDTVQLQWTPLPWPDSHKGPVIDYLAACNGECTTTTAAALKFTKIDAAGVVTPSPVPGHWASDDLAANNNTWSVKIPSSLKAGNYVLRHEIIALHGAGSLNGAQNYPQCVNLKVSGGGTTALPAGVAGSALYKNTDPGILFNLYTTFTSYPIPGPAVTTIKKKVRKHVRDWVGIGFGFGAEI